MRHLLLTLGLLIALAVPAHADVWDFSWSVSELGTQLGGQTTATVTVAPACCPSAVGPDLHINWTSPAGPITFDVRQLPGATLVWGPIPVFVPDPPPSPLFLSRGWTTGTPITRPGAYSWTGPFDHPATFTISGVPFDGDVGIPMTAVLNATGVLEPNGGTVSAAEPNGLLVAMAALVGLGAWRRSARQR